MEGGEGEEIGVRWEGGEVMGRVGIGVRWGGRGTGM